MENNGLSRKSNNKKHHRRIAEGILVLLFTLVLACGFVLSLCLPLRPSVSENEKRELSPFPAFSFKALFDGSYFHGIDLWFSDTFPLRESIIAVNSRIQSLHGIGNVQIKGNLEQGDDIPDAPLSTTEPPSDLALQTTATEPPTTAKEPEDDPDVPRESFDSFLLYGTGGYDYYKFRKDMANRYIGLINRTAAGSNAALYSMVVPISTDIILPESVKKSINSSDQKKASEYLYGSMAPDIKTIPVYDSLMAHRNEYIYFRTDHHWTALGAYYCYVEWAKVKGVEPVPLSKYEKVTYDGFLGSFYAATNKNAGMKKNPDYVDAYKPFNNVSMRIRDKKGNEFGNKVLTDVSTWSASSKYLTFIGGDNPYTVIENKDLTDGSSCIVVKESYANAFVPFLIPHYQTIHVVDFRYWSGNVVSFAKEKNIDDILYLNNISVTRSEPLIKRMEKVSG